ncbi:MAG TPA: hypothetical protein DCX08_09195 [Porticoccaceae bacterium]|jgi:hypothetical protein|nr:hypothetical protein [Porticoccaceae bacterium]
MVATFRNGLGANCNEQNHFFQPQRLDNTIFQIYGIMKSDFFFYINNIGKFLQLRGKRFWTPNKR